MLVGVGQAPCLFWHVSYGWIIFPMPTTLKYPLGAFIHSTDTGVFRWHWYGHILHGTSAHEPVKLGTVKHRGTQGTTMVCKDNQGVT